MSVQKEIVSQVCCSRSAFPLHVCSEGDSQSGVLQPVSLSAACLFRSRQSVRSAAAGQPFRCASIQKKTVSLVSLSTARLFRRRQSVRSACPLRLYSEEDSQSGQPFRCALFRSRQSVRSACPLHVYSEEDSQSGQPVCCSSIQKKTVSQACCCRSAFPLRVYSEGDSQSGVLQPVSLSAACLFRRR